MTDERAAAASQTSQKGATVQRIDLSKTQKLNDQPEEGRTSVRIRDFVLRHGIRPQAHPEEPKPGTGTGSPDETVVEIDTTDKYSVEGVLARGLMGTVFVARDTNIHRRVAMKVMFKRDLNGANDHEKLIRFVTEAQITGQLEHPNIVPLHEFGVDERDNVFYSMKFIEGMHLRELLDAIRDGNTEVTERYPLSQLLIAFQKIADAIAFSHSRGVIHRDLKPENVMLGNFGEVVVMDWGLAKTIDTEDGRSKSAKLDLEHLARHIETIRSAADLDAGFKTSVGAVMGTPLFMAPEQATGKEKVDERADIYALGGILYAMLTLATPVPGGSVSAILKAKVRGDITPPTAFNDGRSPLPHCPHQRVPESLSAVAMKALSVDPRERYQTVAELQEDVSAYQHGYATGAEEAGTLRQFVLLMKRRHQQVFALLAALATLTVVVGLSVREVLRANHDASVALMAAARLAAPAFPRGPGGPDDAVMLAVRTMHRLEKRRDQLVRDNPAQKALRFRYSIGADGVTLDLTDNPELDNIAALRGVPLGGLILQGTRVADLEPLTGMPLKALDLRDTPAMDLAPLAAAPHLERLLLPSACLDLDPIRNLPALRYLSRDDPTQPAEAFWQQESPSPPAD